MKNKGFTLIEILIAILILGIVLSTVYASYTGTFRIIRATQSDNDIYGMARSALDRMARDLQSAALWRGAFTFVTKRYTLGKREFMRLTFRSAAHIAFSDVDVTDGVAVIEYGIEEGTDKEGYILTRSDSLYRNPGKEGTPPGGFLICDRVEALTYTFFDQTGKEYNDWNSEGDFPVQQKRAPAAALVRLSFVNEADREHPYIFMTRVYLPFNHPEVP
jgi:prepilin-type N-terminal cleavage/methylation domain-containing protein